MITIFHLFIMELLAVDDIKKYYVSATKYFYISRFSQMFDQNGNQIHLCVNAGGYKYFGYCTKP